MVRAWYHDGLEEQPDQPHMAEPDQFLTTDQLKEAIGLEYFQFDADKLDSCPAYAEFKKTRGFDYEDSMEMSRQALPDFEQKAKNSYTEHMHPFEEIRFVTAGRAFFDMRARDDRWIRVELVKNDFVIIPRGMYHRVALDSECFIKMQRVFTKEPLTELIKRPDGDGHPVRQKYLNDMGVAIPVA